MHPQHWPGDLPASYSASVPCSYLRTRYASCSPRARPGFDERGLAPHKGPPDRSRKGSQRAPGAPCTGNCSPSTTRPSRLPAIDRLEGFPCLKAFVLPTGAPGDAPPCIRQRSFVIAGDRHGIPLLVLAPHRGLRCMGNLLCIGLFLKFRSNPLSPSPRMQFGRKLSTREASDPSDQKRSRPVG